MYNLGGIKKLNIDYFPNALNDYDDCTIHYDIRRLWKKHSQSKNVENFLLVNIYKSKKDEF